MSKNCFEIFPAGGLKVLRLSLDNLQVSATVEICVARARARIGAFQPGRVRLEDINIGLAR